MRTTGRYQRAIAPLLILASFLLSGTPAVADPVVYSANHTSGAVVPDAYYRTELYCGRSIPGGGAVSDAAWEKFLADVVTPRFPGGFTVLKATGQYRETNGTIVKEPTEVLLFFYLPSKRTSSRRKIEEIRRAYVKQFRQESVIRLDFPTPIRVSF